MVWAVEGHLGDVAPSVAAVGGFVEVYLAYLEFVLFVLLEFLLLEALTGEVHRIAVSAQCSRAVVPLAVDPRYLGRLGEGPLGVLNRLVEVKERLLVPSVGLA